MRYNITPSAERNEIIINNFCWCCGLVLEVHTHQECFITSRCNNYWYIKTMCVVGAIYYVNTAAYEKKSLLKIYSFSLKRKLNTTYWKINMYYKIHRMCGINCKLILIDYNQLPRKSHHVMCILHVTFPSDRSALRKKIPMGKKELRYHVIPLSSLNTDSITHCTWRFYI